MPTIIREYILQNRVPPNVKHGEYAYARYKCRCPICLDAHNTRSATRRERAGAEMMNNPDDPRHGTNNGYSNLGCRCDRCKAAKAAMHQVYLERRRAEKERQG